MGQRLSPATRCNRAQTLVLDTCLSSRRIFMGAGHSGLSLRRPPTDAGTSTRSSRPTRIRRSRMLSTTGCPKGPGERRTAWVSSSPSTGGSARRSLSAAPCAASHYHQSSTLSRASTSSLPQHPRRSNAHAKREQRSSSRHDPARSEDAPPPNSGAARLDFCMTQSGRPTHSWTCRSASWRAR